MILERFEKVWPMTIPTKDLTLDDVPASDSSDVDIIRFAQTLNGYHEVGGEARDLGIYVTKLDDQPLDSLSLDDLRILLFARQRAHYHQGGGWPDGDPIMDEMRMLTVLIRTRLENRS
jgi:hypothetical protein